MLDNAGVVAGNEVFKDRETGSRWQQSSLEAISRILRISPQTRIVILTMEHDPEFMREAYAAGALGYVLKESAATELVQALRTAAAAG